MSSPRAVLLAGIGVVVGLGLGGCGREPAPPAEPAPIRADASRLDGGKALKEVADFVAIGPRVSGTEGANRAATYIHDRLQQLGLQPVMDVFTEPARTTVFRNVTAELRAGGDAPLVVLVSHFDTKRGISESFAGANDSGSSTGLLLELARILALQSARPCDILFAFVDGEECHTRYSPSDGLHGSRRLARRLVLDGRRDRVAAVIVADMVGDRDLMVGIPRNSTPSLVALTFAAAKVAGTRSAFSLSRVSILDDHVPFLEAGMPAIDLIDFAYGSAPGKNDYWHTDEDTMDKLSADSLQTVGRTIIEMINTLGNEAA